MNLVLSVSPKKYFVLSTTEGCATNLLENNAYRRQYQTEGMIAATNAEEADVILINTCGYSKEMEDRAVGIIKALQEAHPGKEIRLAGCLPKINPVKIRKDFSQLEISHFPEIPFEQQGNAFENEDFQTLSWKHRLVLIARPIFFKAEEVLGFRVQPLHNLMTSVIVNKEFYLITASTGCLGHCTFCAIKKAKGSLKSRPLPTLISEFQKGLSEGFKNFWLLGDDIGCWGQDINLSIVDLLSEFTKIDADFNLVINYMDPQFLVKYEAALDLLFKDSRIIGVNIPIQSGSNKILKSMSRVYQAQPVLEMISKFKSDNAGLAIKTNIIVGFPGETWADFFQSLKAVFGFDAILALKFTARPGTPAANYPLQISELSKSVRHIIINLVILVRHAWVAISSAFHWQKV